jgi:hypothetical protein
MGKLEFCNRSKRLSALMVSGGEFEVSGFIVPIWQRVRHRHMRHHIIVKAQHQRMGKVIFSFCFSASGSYEIQALNLI